MNTLKRFHITQSWILVFLLLISIGSGSPLYAFGSREKATEPAVGKTSADREREIEIFLLAPRGEAPAAGALGKETATYLYNQFKVSGTATQMSSSRSFSMPVAERKPVQEINGATIHRYRLDLIPSERIEYRLIEELSFSFDAAELVSSGRIRLQPGQQALLQVAGKAKVAEGLIRVESMRLNSKGVFSGTVQIAAPVP